MAVEITAQEDSFGGESVGDFQSLNFLGWHSWDTTFTVIITNELSILLANHPNHVMVSDPKNGLNKRLD